MFKSDIIWLSLNKIHNQWIFCLCINDILQMFVLNNVKSKKSVKLNSERMLILQNDHRIS